MHGRLLIYFPFCWLATLFTTIRNKETIHQKGYFCFFGGVLITDFVKWQEKKKSTISLPYRALFFFFNKIDDRYAIS